MIGLSICSTIKKDPRAVPFWCEDCGTRIFYVPSPRPAKRVCGNCAINELERMGKYAVEITPKGKVEKFEDEGTKALVKRIRQMLEKEGA